jgi:hypothetical protein
MTSFTIFATTTIRTRTYLPDIQVSTRQFGLSDDAWICRVYEFLEASSRLVRVNGRELFHFNKMVGALSRNSFSMEIINRKAELVGRKEIYQLFACGEELADTWKQGNKYKYTCTANFRKFVFKAAEQIDFKEQVSRSALRFRTRFSTKAEPRKLISDLSNNALDVDLAAPVGALAHKTARELVEKTEARLEADLAQIQAACISELSVCAELRRNIAAYSEEEFTPVELAFGLKLIKSRANLRGAEVDEYMYSRSAKEIVGLYAHLISRYKLAYLGRTFDPHFAHSARLIAEILRPNGIHMLNTGYKILYMPQRMINAELVACFVLLLTYTGWNAETLLAMSMEMIEVHAEHVWIQGYKGRIDEYTDKVYLDEKQPYALEAIRLLIWNRKQLINLGLLPESANWMWCGWSAGFKAHEHQHIGFRADLIRLQLSYGLPKFTLEQIRPQVLALESLRTRNPDHVKQIALHRSIATTGHYLDQLLLRRTNSAINLEFQRRLEATILFRLSETHESFKARVTEAHVDLRLLMPIGDGASCANPYDPPDEKYLLNSICDGRRCHIGSGCKNRKLVIDRDALEALVRKRHYYLSSWERLERNNSSVFEALHIPAILFVLGLYDYISNSPYKHILFEIEKKARNEIAR